jgi:DUF1680 family protein
MDGVKVKIFLLKIICGVLLLCNIYAQDKLYSNTFPLGDVVLLDGPFKHARDLNIQNLLKYNVDRLLAPYRKQAKLTVKASSYINWDGLDGHVGGHYLSAMAMNYAATGNSECKQRMDYMISELKTCQDANATNYPDWGIGYAGGVPNSNSIWSTFKKGDFTAYRNAWVPWYNLHKIYAGLRDAWSYAGSEDAKIIFLKFCNWGIDITSALSDSQMESMLGTEHGGMNEIFADAYQMTGDAKYLTAAKRFTHKEILNAMSASIDNLDNKHANTQVPKAVGFQRIAGLSNDEKYIKAARFFWETVTGKRSLAFGGNSRREHFPPASASVEYISEVQGPESCNSNNMLKLTEDLFMVNPLAKYADYYERTLYNHILSSQHPEHGGYVYFTPARPHHYRVYSAPNMAMWCCVGTGMENHGKYGEFIYTHQNDSLFINLFIASELNWKEKGIKIKQETNFPNEEKTKLIVTEGSSQFKMMIRYPYWVAAGALKVIINNDTSSITEQPSSYLTVDRLWSSGDIVEIILPMHTRLEQLPNVPAYVAFMHGPILLGAKTGTENLAGLVADDSRWGHIASGQMLPLDKAPIIVEDDRSKITNKLVPVQDKPLNFTAPELNIVNSQNIEFEPFYKIHNSRYMMYWMTLTNSQYQAFLDSIAAGSLENRTIDSVEIGVQQSETDHAMQTSNSYSGTHMGEFWRDARNLGYFSYNLKTNGETKLYLMVRYWGNESGSRTFDILIDNNKLVTENITGKWNISEFRNIEYTIPDSMVEGREKIRVKFQAPSNGYAGGVFYIRLLRTKSSTDIDNSMNQPKFFELEQNYPNPFNPSTTIKYELEGSANINVNIFDSLGQLVRSYLCGWQNIGTHSIVWDGKNQTGDIVSTGTYFYQINKGQSSLSKKMLLLK